MKKGRPAGRPSAGQPASGYFFSSPFFSSPFFSSFFSSFFSPVVGFVTVDDVVVLVVPLPELPPQPIVNAPTANAKVRARIFFMTGILGLG